jgi:hypothetical protein
VNPLQYLFDTPIMVPCFLANLLTVAMPLVVIIFLANRFFTLAGRYLEVLWLVILASVIHWVLLGWIYAAGRKVKVPDEGFIHGV